MVVQALRTRQPAVLEDLLAAYGREIQSVAYLIVRDRTDAEDVVVETLIAALEHGPALRDEQALRAWLLRIATNRALSMRRRTSSGSRSYPTWPARRPAETATAEWPCSTGSTVFRHGCGRRSCCATTPT
jgi:RNA polymerase sigma-70 factor (ECF subfamily)